MPTLVYLIGFMGCGKTTLGSILANMLGYDFIDLDEALEERLGCSIQTYFEEEGEPAFRRLEQEMVRETTRMTRCVISTGGGVFLNEANRLAMSEHGLTVYLRLSVSHLTNRLQNSRHRPLLFDDEGSTLQGPALEERIAQLLDERAPFYEQADLIVDIEPDSVGRTVDRIEAAIQSFSNKPA